MSYNDYVTAVAKNFKKCGYTDKDTDKYFATKEVSALLRKHYEGYNDKKFASYSPEATASCLDMMY